MRTDNFAGEYQAKTDAELSRSAMNLGPPLPSEVSKPPWRPKVAGVIAFFFGPVAGALVVANSLRRLGYQDRAKNVMFLALVWTVVEAAMIVSLPIRLTNHIALRPLEYDLLIAGKNPSAVLAARVSTGIVFRFGQ